MIINNSIKAIIIKGTKILTCHMRTPEGKDYYTLPGGKQRPDELMIDALKREVQEETGLTVSNLQNCGYIQWYNPIKQSQYFVFLFKTSTFSGELTGSVEGNVKWMTLDEMLAGKLAPNMTKYLAVFQNENIPQAYGISGQGLNLVISQGNCISEYKKMVDTEEIYK